MWGLQRSLHGRCDLTFCPSPSTARMLGEQRFDNVRLWPRVRTARYDDQGRARADENEP